MVGVNMRKEIIVKTPSRLHIGLIDLNGSIGRIDGGLGLTLAKPNFTIRVSESDELRLDVPAQYERSMIISGSRLRSLFRPMQVWAQGHNYHLELVMQFANSKGYLPIYEILFSF
jgi:beta-RFAP synthase